VGGQSGQERASRLFAEGRPTNPPFGPSPDAAVGGQGKRRLGREVQWRQQTVDQALPTTRNSADDPAPGSPVAAEFSDCSIEIAIDDSSRTLVHRMSEGRCGLSELQAIPCEVKRSEGW
jgi:hypothetical protein